MSDALLGMVGTGLSLFGGIEGLIGGANAEHQAEIAAENAIRDFKSSSNAEYLGLLSSGTAGLENLSGGLNNALVSGGRSLGAALAGTGISNSTAAAGAVANQAAANASVEGRYSTGVASELLQQQNQTNQQADQMSYGLAVNNLNFARQQTAGAQSGLGQFFGNMGQMNFGNLFGTNNGGSIPGTSAPQTGNVLAPTNGLAVASQNQWYGNGIEQPSYNMGNPYPNYGSGLPGG